MKNRPFFMFVITTLIICCISFSAWAEESFSDGSGSGVSQPLNIHPPTVLQRVDIVYPEFALMCNIQGNVQVSVTISEDGEISNVKVRSSSGYSMLDYAAVECVKKWKFAPAYDENGKNVNAIALIPIHFIITPEQENPDL